MSIFDVVVVDGIKYQTKALGKGHQTVHPGDAVEVEAVAQTEAEYAVGRTRP